MAPSIRRWLSEQPLEWPEAYLKLIDALREYIRSDEAVARDLLNDGHITRKIYDEGMADLQPMRKMLADLEKHEINPSLGILNKKLGL